MYTLNACFPALNRTALLRARVDGGSGRAHREVGWWWRRQGWAVSGSCQSQTAVTVFRSFDTVIGKIRFMSALTEHISWF